MPCGGGRNNIDASKLLYNCLFFRRDQDFYNLVIRDEFEICSFFILRIETRAVESESREVGKSLKIGKNRIKSEKSDLISY